MKIPAETLDPDVVLDLRIYGKYMAFLRRHPVHAARILFGIVIPPHEGAMLSTAWDGYKTNIYTCSRGTSKSFTIGSLFPPIKSLLFRNINTLIASASKFRGGKLVLTDSSRLLKGGLKNQKLGNNWGAASLGHKPTYIKKDPDMWHIDFKSNSSIYTIPTANEESVRGMRANILIIDERNIFDGELIQKVYLPFLAVGSDFEATAKGSEDNQAFYVGTIDYTYRDWHREIQSVKDIAKLQYELHRALMEGNWIAYDKLMNDQGHRLRNASVAIVRYDYTDLLIPTRIGDYKINYPGAQAGKQIKWDDRDQTELVYTYPLEKRQIESSLDEGIIDRDTWAAEHRNQFIQADGNVFPYDLIETITGPNFTIAEEKKRGWDPEEKGFRYIAPLLYECTDPCVLGVDIARSQDFAAFIVIRVGPITSSGPYDLHTHKGNSSWSNIIWAEQHQLMTSREIAEKIRELRSRYNIMATRQIPGLVMDSRGGGANVRDELVIPSAPVDSKTGLPDKNWASPQRIFDPEDKEERMGLALLGDSTAWPGLKLLQVTDMVNMELVGFTKGQMQTSKLYMASNRNRRFNRDPSNKLYLGYVGVETLKHQLLRLQAVMTPTQKSVRYEMPGDPNRIENKKDLAMGLLYACFALREWLTTLKQERPIPAAYAEVVYLNNFGRR